jgi:hypothetical protein
MRFKKLFFSFGMIGAVAFLLEDFLGISLWKGYNPVTSYVSELFADGAPHIPLTRTLLYINEICLVIFILALLVQSFQHYRICLRIGYICLLVVSSISIVGYGLFPMTLDFIFNPKNYIHLALTILILAATIFLLFLLAFGYLKQEHESKIGRITLTAATLFLIFNLLHLFSILGGLNILGLMERLTLYTFQTYIFVLSWNYVMNRRLKIDVY